MVSYTLLGTIASLNLNYVNGLQWSFQINMCDKRKISLFFILKYDNNKERKKSKIDNQKDLISK